MPKLTFGKTERLFGDLQVPMFVDGKEDATLVKPEDGAEWYTHGLKPDGSQSRYFCDMDFYPTLRDTKREARRCVRLNGEAI